MSDNIRNSQGVDAILGDPKKALWKMSIPLIISLLITSLYSVIDAIWVSGLGADALAGVGFVSPIFIALMGMHPLYQSISVRKISKKQIMEPFTLFLLQ